MLRRSLLRREIQYSQPSSAKGSRPRARDSVPFVPPDPLPKNKRSKLDKQHFLAAYDTLHSLLPSANIQAFVADKPSYGFDMLCLLQDSDRTLTPLDIFEHVDKFKHKMEHFGSAVTTTTKCTVSFHDLCKLSVGFGVQGVTMKELNATPEWHAREVLRTSLNRDTDEWESEWSFVFKDMVDRLQSKSEEQFDKDWVEFPRHYWATHAYWAQQRTIEVGVDLYLHVLEEFWPALHKPLAYPILLDENLNTLRVAQEMARSARPTTFLGTSLPSQSDVFEKLPIGLDPGSEDDHAKYQRELDYHSRMMYLERQKQLVEESKQKVGLREKIQNAFDKISFIDRIKKPTQ